MKHWSGATEARRRERSLIDLMLLSNSYSPGLGLLEHALDTVGELLGAGSRVLFVPFADSDPDRYADAMSAALAPVGARVTGAHRVADPVRALAEHDAVFVGGGNSFRLLRAAQRCGLLPAIRERVAAGLPYLGTSAGANLACPTIRTTNDMPIVAPASLGALALIPFQINPHYPAASPGAGPGETRDQRLHEFLEENDVPVLALREGSWLRVQGPAASIGGTAGGRVFTRGAAARPVEPGDDVSYLLTSRPAYDTGRDRVRPP
jgi:dipeptidase E